MNYKLATQILSAALVYDITIELINKKRFGAMKQQRDNARELVRLYAEKLNDSGIEPDDFEMIIMKNLSK